MYLFYLFPIFNAKLIWSKLEFWVNFTQYIERGRVTLTVHIVAFYIAIYCYTSSIWPFYLLCGIIYNCILLNSISYSRGTP